jgi:Brp/Blh family beta-carotene 15,15'-monooxygenase
MVTNTANNGNLLYWSSAGRSYQFTILVIACLALGGSFFLPVLSIEQQFWIVIVPIGVFGLSHGGADTSILKKLTATSKSNVLLLLLAYMLASLAFVALIWTLPLVALLVFLGMSVWHFGYTDEAFLSSERDLLLRCLSGSMAVLGPILGHPQQTSELFSWLIKIETSAVLDVLVWMGPLLAGLWLLGFAYMMLRKSNRPSLRVLAEWCLVGATLIVLPPLLSFAFYFCVIHSMRHFLAISEHCLLSNQKSLAKAFPARKIIPSTLGALVLAIVAWGIIVWIEPSPSLLTEAIRVMFWALAALTFPHAIIVRLWWDQRPAE